MNRFKNKPIGFSLVELIVSVAITGIIMLGMSSFFTNALHNTLQEQEEANQEQGQFVVNEILREKFRNTVGLISDVAVSPQSAVLQNDPEQGGLPFSFISENEPVPGEKRIVFRDFMIFNGLVGNSPSVNSGLENPAGVSRIGSGNYYIALPTNNTLQGCVNTDMTGCNDLGISGLDYPVGVTNDGTDLYVTDAGNNRVVQISDLGGGNTVTEIATGFDFPTGLAHYNDGTNDYLFVADSGNNQVKRVELDNANAVSVVVGEGENSACDNSALYCKLSFPTGLHVDGEDLYIADTGNNRILKMSDPPTKTGAPADDTFDFTLDDNYALDRIELSGNFTTTGYNAGPPSNLIGVDGNYASETFTSATRDFDANVYVFDNCFVTPSWFHIEAMPPGQSLSSGDIIVIGGNAYTVQNYVPNERNCDTSGGTDIRDRVQVSPADLVTNGVVSDDRFYFANPSNTTMSLTGINFSSSGFQQVDIDTYEIGNGTPENDILPYRVGDGILGTPEDTISVLVAGGLNFPTGLSMTGNDLTVADSLNGQVRDFDKVSGAAGSSNGFTAYTTNFSLFDYTSDFTIQGLTFSASNSSQLLELSIEADLNTDEGTTKIYTLNANL